MTMIHFGADNATSSGALQFLGLKIRPSHIDDLHELTCLLHFDMLVKFQFATTVEIDVVKVVMGRLAKLCECKTPLLKSKWERMCVRVSWRV